VRIQAPETLTLPDGELTRAREVDGDQIALAVAESLDHLRPWMRWANPAATQIEAQRARCGEAEQKWSQGSDYSYVLRPRTDVVVIGSFGLHRRVGPGALEIGYWLHTDWTGHGHATAAAGADLRRACPA
jgi:ribosomal-protein-serine acetyltransferase